MEYVVERGQTRLEACFDRVSEVTMPLYERYRAWFEAEGLVRVDENAYMRRGLTPREFTEHDVVLPPGYWYVPMVDATRRRYMTATAKPSRRAASGRTTT